jgi:hypothetical protein
MDRKADFKTTLTWPLGFHSAACPARVPASRELQREKNTSRTLLCVSDSACSSIAIEKPVPLITKANRQKAKNINKPP